MSQRYKPLKNDLYPKQWVKLRDFRGWPRFIRDLFAINIIATPVIKCLKKGKFKWEEKQEANFALLMEKLSIALILALSNFSKVLEDECDALVKVIVVVLF